MHENDVWFFSHKKDDLKMKGCIWDLMARSNRVVARCSYRVEWLKGFDSFLKVRKFQTQIWQPAKALW